MSDQPVVKKTLAQLQEQIKFSTLEDLQYLLTYYCGPRKTLLREKHYDYEASKRMKKMVRDAISMTAFEDICLSDS